MAPRPSMGVPGPRAMPPYKYATGVRNPNPQVVQPIALQQVWAKDQSHHLVLPSFIFFYLFSLSSFYPSFIAFIFLLHTLFLSGLMCH